MSAVRRIGDWGLGGASADELMNADGIDVRAWLSTALAGYLRAWWRVGDLARRGGAEFSGDTGAWAAVGAWGRQGGGALTGADHRCGG